MSFQHMFDYPYWLLPSIAIAYFGIHALLSRNKGFKYPSVGTLDALIPTFIHNVIYAFYAGPLLERGYTKFRDSAFQLTRNNEPIIVLPHSLLEELASLPATVASPQAALRRDLLGHYTGVDQIVENNLHHYIVQRRLTPRIPRLIPAMERAVIAAFEKHFPNSDEWTEICPLQVIRPISAKVAADALVGPEFSDDPTWLDISVHYTEKVFATMAILRMFPTWVQWAIAPLLPTARAPQRYLRRTKRLLGPRIAKLIMLGDDAGWEPSDDSPYDTNLLAWLASSARGRNRDPDVIAQALVLVALASVHTTLLRMVSVLYDVTAAGSGLRDQLVNEIAAIAAAGPGGWGSDAYGRLHKLDSVLRESQRMSPPVVTGMKRVFARAHTFGDGTHVPAGAYACMPVHAIENDEAHTPDPGRFDGLRSFRARQEWERQAASSRNSNSSEFLFDTPTLTSLSFGYGKTACPGRFFASHAIKVVLVKMFSDYEFRFLPGAGRPPGIMAHEFLFPSPEQKILVRRNKEAACPF
ncbi:cytochrome P450 [Hypoxylon crocopeplum]|nr:cytochrome P450 [Hypoxylon crocopeplum]